MNTEKKPLLSEWIERKELARELNVTPDTLARWAGNRIGPPWVKIGRRVLYRRSAVAEWLANIERRNTNG
ncbi:helix-turn-helix transcriptional regulator [Profundibacter sp.]